MSTAVVLPERTSARVLFMRRSVSPFDGFAVAVHKLTAAWMLLSALPEGSQSTLFSTAPIAKEASEQLLDGSSHKPLSDSPTQGRMALFDVMRGFSVISMVLFHLCYDMRIIYGLPLGFFKPPLQDIWRASISWTFLFVAGCMCSFSRNNLKRSLRYLGAAALVFVVTVLVAVDTPISFGIIFCMGGSTLIYHLLDSAHLAPTGLCAACLLFVAFVLLRGVPNGYIGIGTATVELPRWVYATKCLAFAGFPGPGFASGDYYPLIPFTLMYLTGAAMGRHWRQKGYPVWFSRVTCAPLQAVGRHALPVYLLHQPLILAVLELVL